MVQVQIWGSLRRFTDGKASVEVEAATFKELLDGLERDYPGLRPQIERGVSVAIDGLIYRDAWFTPIKPENEIVLMPYMKGG